MLCNVVNLTGLVIRRETHNSHEYVVYFAGYRLALHHLKCLANHGHLPRLSQLKASYRSRGLALTPVLVKKSQPPENSSSKINITTL